MKQQTEQNIEFLSGLVERASLKTNEITEKRVLDSYKELNWGPSFIKDQSPYILLMGGRRAAKTTTLAAKIGFTDLFFKTQIKDSHIFYCSTTFDHAMSLMWKKLVFFQEYFDIKDWDMNKKSTGIIETPRCIIRVLGMNDIDAIHKAFGEPFKLFIIDEAQGIRSDILRILKKDAASWGAFDADGTVILAGNPSRFKYHFWSQEWLGGRAKNYHATIWENPFKTLEEKEKFLDEKRKAEGEVKGKESAEFRRLAYGELVFESSNTVFSISPRNYYEEAPDNLKKIIGVDLGWKAHDAIVVLGWHKGNKDEEGKIYLLEEHQKKEQSFQDLVDQVNAVADKHEANIIVIDTGGLVQKSLPDLVNKYTRRQWVAAQKGKDKLKWIKVLQTEIRHSRFLVKQDCLFERETSLIEWDDNLEKINDKIHHSDILDAILYAMRYCHNHLTSVVTDPDDISMWDPVKRRLATPELKEDDWAVDNTATDW